MKKIIIILITIVIIVGVSICIIIRRDSSNNDNNESVINTQKSEESKVDEDNIKEWGVKDKFVTESSDTTLCTIHIKLPSFTSISEGPGRIAYQDDGSLVIMGGQRSFNEDKSNPDELFPYYFDNVISILKFYRNWDYENFAFEISEKEQVEINGYEMCKYKGTHTYTFNNEPKTMQYVAYTTFAKENGAAIYWMVLDESEDQALAKVIDSHAYKMALSIYEEE